MPPSEPVGRCRPACSRPHVLPGSPYHRTHPPLHDSLKQGEENIICHMLVTLTECRLMPLTGLYMTYSSHTSVKRTCKCQAARHVAAQDGHLLSGYLTPACIISHQRYNWSLRERHKKNMDRVFILYFISMYSSVLLFSKLCLFFLFASSHDSHHHLGQ